MKKVKIEFFQLRDQKNVVAMLEAITRKPTRLEVGNVNYYISKAEIVDMQQLERLNSKIEELQKDLDTACNQLNFSEQERKDLEEKITLLENEIKESCESELVKVLNRDYLTLHKKLGDLLEKVKGHQNEIQELRKITFESLKKIRDM